MSGGGPPDRLARRLRLARLSLGWEALWPVLWPALGVAGLFLLLALAGLFLAVPPWLHLVLLLGFAAALVRALRRLRAIAPPGEVDAARRLERDSGLRHRPLQALADRPATTDPAGLALWRAHRARAAAQAAGLRVAAPRPNLAAHDPRALRLGLAVALMAALGVAGGEAPERVRRALWPAFPVAPAPAAARIEAWVAPPAHTGAAPILLEAAGGRVEAPARSALRVALSGGPPGPAPVLATEGGEIPFRSLDATGFSAEAALERDGRVAVLRGGAELAAWTFALRPDAPPAIAFAEPPAARDAQLRLPWRAEDDWGLHGARVELRLALRAEAPPLALPLSLPPGAPRQARGVAQPDLTAHPWAGLAVTARLVARDGAGQEGASEPAALTLPERRFEHPVARELVRLRRDLSVEPMAREPARRGLDRLSAEPAAFDGDAATFLVLRAARARLARDRRPEAVAEVQALLWELAVALEEGRADRTARAVAAAREAVREALDDRDRARRQAEAAREERAGEEPGGRADAPPGAVPPDRAEAEARAELERRAEALREAIRRHLDALAEAARRERTERAPGERNQAERSPGEAPAGQQRREERREPGDLDRRAERLRDAAREDRTEDARRELAELEQQLRDLQEGRAEAGESPERRQQRERGRQQMSAAQDLLRRQAELLDQAERRAQEPPAPRGQREGQREGQPEGRRGAGQPGQGMPQPQSGPGQAGGARAGQEGSGTGGEAGEASGARREARTQRALRRALGELMQQHGDLTGEVPEGLGRADRAMREAQEALGEGRDPRAAQARAMRALQEGGREMAARMQRQMGRGQEGGEDGEDSAEAEGEGPGEGREGTGGAARRGQAGVDRERGQGQGRDPLGRPLREAPGAGRSGGDTRVPDEAEALSTRQLQDELRRRGADRTRAPEELDYIERLLRRF